MMLVLDLEFDLSLADDCLSFIDIYLMYFDAYQLALHELTAILRV